MKGIQIYLTVVTILLIIALGFGVYVWYVIQDMKRGTGTTETIKPPLVEELESEEAAPTPSKATSSTLAPIEEPVIIDISNLSENQRSILETLGYTNESITITPAMLACANDAVGEERLAKIVDGAAPTPLESMKLLPCFKK